MPDKLNAKREELRVVAKNLIKAATIPYFLTEEEIINELEFFASTVSDHEFSDKGKNQNKLRRGWLLKANDTKKRKRYPVRKV